MSNVFFIRWSGLAALAAGALIVIADSLSLLLIGYDDYGESATTGTFVAQQILFLPGASLLLGSVIGLHGR